MVSVSHSIISNFFFLDEILKLEKNTYIDFGYNYYDNYQIDFHNFCLGDFLMEYEVNIEEDTTIIEKFPSISRGLYIHDFQVTINYI